MFFKKLQHCTVTGKQSIMPLLRGYGRKYAKLVYVTFVRWRSGQTYCCYVRTCFTRGILTSYFFSHKKRSIIHTLMQCPCLLSQHSYDKSLMVYTAGCTWYSPQSLQAEKVNILVESIYFGNEGTVIFRHSLDAIA